MTQHRRRFEFSFLVLPFVVFLILVAIPVWIRCYLHAYHNFDLGIYSQAINEISNGKFNPYLSVRQIRIFNDHWDPILFLSVVPSLWLKPPYAGLLLEHLFVFLSGVFFLWFWFRKEISFPAAMIGILYVLFSPGLLSAVAFPIHPTTWAIFPAIGLVYSLYKKQSWQTVLWLLLLFSCKEEFVFCGFVLMAYFSYQRNVKLVLWISIVTIGWFLFVFFVRQKVFEPPFESYGDGLLKGFLENPFLPLTSIFTGKKNFQNIFLLFFPMVFLLILGHRKGGRILWVGILVAIPVFLIRLISVKWDHHYLPPLVGFFAAVMVFSFPKELWNVRLLALFSVFLLLVNLEGLIKSATLDVPHLRGLSSSQKWERAEKIHNRLATLLEDKTAGIVAQADLIPGLSTSSLVYQFRRLDGGYQDVYEKGSNASGMIYYQKHKFNQLNVKTYKWLILEKPPYGDAFDVGHDHIQAMIDAIRREIPEAIVDDSQYLLLARGNFVVVP